MNQTFNKKALTASVAAALATGGVAYANVFADSTAGAVSAGLVVKGGALKKTSPIVLTETGSFTNGSSTSASQPIGVRITIPAGLTLYGAKLAAASSTGTASNGDVSALSLTSGTTYALRLTGVMTEDGVTGKAGSYVIIDTNSSSPNATNMSAASTSSGAATGALYALFTATNSTTSAAASYGAEGNVYVSGAGLGAVNVSATNTTAFLGATALAANYAATGTAANSGGVPLRRPDGQLIGGASTFPVGSLTANSDGTMTMVLFTGANNTTANSGDAIIVPPLVVGVGSGSTASGSLAISVTDGPSSAQTGSTNLVGVTNTSVNVLTVASSGISVAKKTSTSVIPVDVQGLSNQVVDPITVTFATPLTAAKAQTVSLVLDNGAKFVSTIAFTGNVQTAYANSFIRDAAVAGENATMFNTVYQYNASCCSDTGTANGSVNCTAGVLSNNNATLTLTMDNEAISVGDAFMLSGSLLDLTSAGTGSVNLTVTSGTSSSTIQVASVAAKGTSVAYKDNSPTGYATLFTGRTGQTTTDAMVITESAAGSLAVNGAITIAASNGALFSSNVSTSEAAVDTTVTGATALVVTDLAITGTGSSSVSGSVTTASSTAYKTTASGFTFNLSSATAGDLTLTVSGGSGASGSAKIATIMDASTVSAGGSLAVGSASGIVALPDVVITEGAAGAITNGSGNYAVLAASTSQVSSFDATSATVKAYDAAGNDISTAVFSAASTSLTAGTQNNTAYARFTTVNASSVPATLKVSGLKATLASTATGDLSLTVAGSGSTTPDLAISVGAGGNEISSNVGAKLTKATVKVGSVVSASVGYYPAATVSGSVTSQNISVGMVPAGNDQSKQGSVFIAAIVPASTGVGGVYFMDSTNTWTLFSSCATAPTYSTGALAAVSGVNLLSAATNLTPLIGTDIYIGYGVGGALSAAGTACNNMLNNGTYSKSYTIK